MNFWFFIIVYKFSIGISVTTHNTKQSVTKCTANDKHFPSSYCLVRARAVL